MTEPVPVARHRGKTIGRIAGALIIATIAVLAVRPSLKRERAPKATTVDTSAARPVIAAPAQPADTSAAPAVDTTSAPADTIAAPILVLEGDGLGYRVGRSSVRHLNFGTDSSAIQTAMSASVGAGTAVACGAGKVEVRYAAFSIFLDGARFVGWSGRAGKATTLDGIGIGTTLADLRNSGTDVTVRGTEWSGAGMSGTLDGTADTSRVTAIRAGETCGAG